MDLELEVEVADNISVSSVEVIYQDSNGEDHVIEAARISGDYKQGNYAVIIPGEHIEGEAITYSWKINDFGNNEVNSESFEVTVLPGITVGYTHDFESTPVGWTSFGENNSWEWGTPESGPESAASGEKLYATNLAGGMIVMQMLHSLCHQLTYQKKEIRIYNLSNGMSWKCTLPEEHTILAMYLYQQTKTNGLN